MIVAICDGDRDEIVDAAEDFGFKTEHGNKMFIHTYALVCFHRGLNPDDLQSCGVPESVGLMDFDDYMNQFDKWQKFPGEVLMLQRCAMVLLGVAAETGAGQLSLAHMWEKEARAYLDSVNKN